MEQTKQPSTLKAILMCILACLAGALVFGLIYYIGYYVYYITALEIIFGVLAFLKFKQSTSKSNIAISIIFSTLLVVVFNFFAVFAVDAIEFSTNPEINMPLGEVINAMIELWKVDPEMAQYFNQRLLEIGGMALLGCVIAIFMVIGNIKKNKQKQQIENISNQPMQEEQNFAFGNQQTSQDPISLENTEQQQNDDVKENNQKIEAQNIYFQYFSQCKSMINQYLADKDMPTFKQNINNLKQSLSEMPVDIKEHINIIIKNEKSISSLSETDKKVLEIMDRMFI